MTLEIYLRTRSQILRSETRSQNPSGANARISMLRIVTYSPDSRLAFQTELSVYSMDSKPLPIVLQKSDEKLCHKKANKNRGSGGRQSASQRSTRFCGSVSATDGLTACSWAKRTIPPSQLRRWPPQGIAVMRATPPLPLPPTHTTPLVPNKTIKDTTTTAPRSPTPNTTLTPRTTAFTTTRMESVITTRMATMLIVRFPLEPTATKRHSCLRSCNPI